LEEATGRPTHRIFKTVVGTSTGGFVTALLTVPAKAHVHEKGEQHKEEEASQELTEPKHERTGEHEDYKEVEYCDIPEGEHAPVLASKALKIYRSNGPKIFPAKVLGTKHLFLSFLLFLGGAIYLFFHLQSLRHVLPEGQRTYAILFETHHCAGLFGTLMLTCIMLAFICFRHLIASICRAKYSGDAVVEFCDEHFCQDARLKYACTNIGICATDIKKRRSFVFNSMRSIINPDCPLHSVPISKIARATSAAPTYFKPEFFHITKSKKNPNPKIIIQKLADEMTPWESRDKESHYDRESIGFEDGGTKMNNPSKAGLKLAELDFKQKDLNPNDYEVRLLSLGTGSLSGEQDDPTKVYHNCILHLLQSIFSRKSKNANQSPADNHSNHGNHGDHGEHKEKGGILGWIDDMIHHEMTGSIVSVIDRRLTGDVFEVLINAHNDHLEVQQQFKENGNPNGYKRQQFKITEHQLNQMDDCSEKNMDDLVKKAEDMIYTVDANGDKQWSEDFKKCVKFLDLKIKNQPKDKISIKFRIDKRPASSEIFECKSPTQKKNGRCQGQVPDQSQASDKAETSNKSILPHKIKQE